jgi:hypothetical protein
MAKLWPKPLKIGHSAENGSFPKSWRGAGGANEAVALDPSDGGDLRWYDRLVVARRRIAAAGRRFAGVLSLIRRTYGKYLRFSTY